METMAAEEVEPQVDFVKPPNVAARSDGSDAMLSTENINEAL